MPLQRGYTVLNFGACLLNVQGYASAVTHDGLQLCDGEIIAREKNHAPRRILVIFDEVVDFGEMSSVSMGYEPGLQVSWARALWKQRDSCLWEGNFESSSNGFTPGDEVGVRKGVRLLGLLLRELSAMNSVEREGYIHREGGLVSGGDGIHGFWRDIMVEEEGEGGEKQQRERSSIYVGPPQ